MFTKTRSSFVVSGHRFQTVTRNKKPAFNFDAGFADICLFSRVSAYELKRMIVGITAIMITVGSMNSVTGTDILAGNA